MSVVDRAKQSWAELKRGKPGKRFQERFRRKNPENGRSAKKLVTLVVGFVVLAAGIFFLPAPGPGMVIVALGAGIIAQGSLAAARALDWAELRIRELIAWGRRVWKNAGALSRVAIVAAGVVIAGAGAYGAWWLTFGR